VNVRSCRRVSLALRWLCFTKSPMRSAFPAFLQPPLWHIWIASNERLSPALGRSEAGMGTTITATRRAAFLEALSPCKGSPKLADRRPSLALVKREGAGAIGRLMRVRVNRVSTYQEPAS
jgi:hypothetical protein